MSPSVSTNYLTVKNQATVPLTEIPTVEYGIFYTTITELLNEKHNHCVSYYAYPTGNGLKFICCIANDLAKNINVLSHELLGNEKKQLLALTKDFYAMHIFEREIMENHGVDFIYHPWKKPVRYAFNRADKNQVINNYPFYKIESEELHEVGVGPIHAGVIEPGHFRFLCNGEMVLHLEIQLGWQHRGVESLFISKPKLIQRTVLSESIAADTAIGHSLAFVSLMESLGSVQVSERVLLERTLALELERIGVHVGDLGVMCIGVAYQLGASVFGTLRTPVINFTQTWCGNRFGKGINRVGGSHYPFTPALRDKLHLLLNKFEDSFIPMTERIFSLPSLLMRAEKIGTVTAKQMELIGAVGMTARQAGVPRDIRQSHPFAAYKNNPIPSKTIETGDVWARFMIRSLEIRDSIDYIRVLMDKLSTINQISMKPIAEGNLKLASNSFCISLSESWRGETCHCAVTGNTGEIEHYKIKDPSMHNWMALALSLRDLEISDFPINNKSYDHSYCGHDL